MSESKDLTSLTQLRSLAESETTFPPAEEGDSPSQAAKELAQSIFGDSALSTNPVEQISADAPISEESPLAGAILETAVGIPPIGNEVADVLNEMQDPSFDAPIKQTDDLMPPLQETRLVTDDLEPLHNESVEKKEEAIVAATPAKNPLASLKSYAESVSPKNSYVAAEFPFKLMVDGQLEIHEQERLLEILKREELGIPPLELETQFQNGRILIPHVSEYTAILLAQTLRNSKARLRILQSESALQDAEEVSIAKSLEIDPSTNRASHPVIENTTVPENNSSGSNLYGNLGQFELTSKPHLSRSKEEHQEVIDTFQLAGFVKGHAQSPPDSQALQQLTERLKDQLKSLAKIKGADGVTHFKIEIEPKPHSFEVWVKVEGLAVKRLLESQRPSQSPGLLDPDLYTPDL